MVYVIHPPVRSLDIVRLAEFSFFLIIRLKRITRSKPRWRPHVRLLTARQFIMKRNVDADGSQRIFKRAPHSEF